MQSFDDVYTYYEQTSNRQYAGDGGLMAQGAACAYRRVLQLIDGWAERVGPVGRVMVVVYG